MTKGIKTFFLLCFPVKQFVAEYQTQYDLLIPDPFLTVANCTFIDLRWTVEKLEKEVCLSCISAILSIKYQMKQSLIFLINIFSQMLSLALHNTFKTAFYTLSVAVILNPKLIARSCSFSLQKKYSFSVLHVWKSIAFLRLQNWMESHRYINDAHDFKILNGFFYFQ